MNEAYYYYEGRYWERWETDFPQADKNFLFRFEQLTSAHPHPKPITRRLMDPDLFDFPLLYMCDVGWMDLSEEEIARLREYLLKGGFLWMDDFWGWAEWNNVERLFARIFPDRAWQEIPPDHEILDTVFELDALPQVPARDFAGRHPLSRQMLVIGEPYELDQSSYRHAKSCRSAHGGLRGSDPFAQCRNGQAALRAALLPLR